MKSATNKEDAFKFDALFTSMQPGNVYFVTGKNGSGKSRFFRYATNKLRDAQLKENFDGERLLCLSGTMHDKYPARIYKLKKYDDLVVYLGNKVNNNMISDTGPFRTLCHYMLRSNASFKHGEQAAQALQKLNLEERVILKFRHGKNRKIELNENINLQLDLYFNDPRHPDLIHSYIEHLDAGNIRLADMFFFRRDVPHGLSDLSSGEKQYALALLGLLYCGAPKCTVFYDEPENSLHPSWQLNIIKDLAAIAEVLYPLSTIVVATHSPLIASSVRNSRAFVCDLPAGQSWQRSDLYGRASDTVLREQFNLYSARSPEVSTAINICLDLIAQNKTQSEDFQSAQNDLRSFNLELPLDDPLYEVVNTILRF